MFFGASLASEFRQATCSFVVGGCRCKVAGVDRCLHLHFFAYLGISLEQMWLFESATRGCRECEIDSTLSSFCSTQNETL